MNISRQQFEEWRRLNKSSTVDLFDVWQASRESFDIDRIKKERNEAIGHLISVFDQYAGLDHSFMSAGEDACEFLEKLGYGTDTGRVFSLSEKILELNNGE
ncbi:hypothetical protein [Morganella morganii]|uniref:hypothetical protein n=1 Tax=Morganella morganii TaxID=582 RepID=UPI0034D41877